MPFVPLSPDEQKTWKEPCRHPEHNPPWMIYLDRPCKWRCPGCGVETMVIPNRTFWCEPDDRTITMEVPRPSNHRDDGGVTVTWGR